MYAVYNYDTKTLTFYYDENSAGLGEGYNHTGRGDVHVYSNKYHNFDLWGSPGLSCEKVVFDPSFADARPTSTAEWFYECYYIKSIDGIEYLNTSKVKDMYRMFSGCESLESLDLSHFNTGQVSSMNSMFYKCSKLELLDLSGFDTRFVKDMAYMFSKCVSLKSLDLSNFNTGKVESMDHMFESCEKLESLNLSGFNTESVTDMNRMFSGCVNLSSLDVSRFKTSNVTDMTSMFADCKRVPFLDVSHFDTRNVTTMRCMFFNCSRLTSLNLSGFDTGKVKDFASMFYGCSGLTSLDLSSFDVNDTPDMGDMFGYCSSLHTVYVGRNGRWVAKQDRYSGVFESCRQLKGGNGTVFKDSADDVSMACVDGGPSSPGYFTAAPGYPTAITLDKTELTLNKDGLAQAVTASVWPKDVAHKKVTWTSRNNDVATVSNGLVYPIGVGTATIVAMTENGIAASCEVTVKEAAKVRPWSVSFPQTDYYLSPGKTCDLGLVIVEAYANDFTVTSTMPQVVEVSADGKSITAREIGNARLIARWTDPDGNAKTAMARVEVR